METAPQGPKVLRQALRKAFEATDDPIPRLRKWLRIVFGLRNMPFTDLFKLYPIISYRYLSLLAPARKTTSCSAPSGKSARQSSAATLSKTGRASRKTAPFHVLRHVFPPVFIVFSWFFHCFFNVFTPFSWPSPHPGAAGGGSAAPPGSAGSPPSPGGSAPCPASRSNAVEPRPHAVQEICFEYRCIQESNDIYT